MPTETDPDNPGSPIEFGPGELEALKATQEALCRATGSVFEVVDSTNEEQYYPLAIFMTLPDALAAITVDDPNDIGCHDHEDWEEWCRVEIRERAIGWCGHGKKVAALEWTSTYDDAADECKWVRKPSSPNNSAQTAGHPAKENK